MGNLGFFEILLIGFVTLILFGPDKLPEVAKKLGKFSADLKRTSDSVRREFYNSLYTPAETLKNETETIRRELRAVSEMHPLCPDTPRSVDGASAAQTLNDTAPAAASSESAAPGETSLVSDFNSDPNHQTPQEIKTDEPA